MSCRSGPVALSSSRMVGIATFTIEASSTAMNWPVRISASRSFWRPENPACGAFTSTLLLAAAHRLDVDRRGELEVVVVRVGERGDPGARRPLEAVGLAHDDRAGGLEPVEVALHVAGFDVPDEPPGLAVLAVNLVVGPDGDAAGSDLPADVALLVKLGLAEEFRVIRGEAR